MYKTGGAVLFPSPHYEKALYKVAENRGINVALKEELVQVDHVEKTATFLNLESKKKETIEVSCIFFFTKFSKSGCGNII